MSSRLMLLPSKDVHRVMLISMPNDIAEAEAYRHVTGLVAEVEDADSDTQREDLIDALEIHGFEMVEFALGPSLD